MGVGCDCGLGEAGVDGVWVLGGDWWVVGVGVADESAAVVT